MLFILTDIFLAFILEEDGYFLSTGEASAFTENLQSKNHKPPQKRARLNLGIALISSIILP